MAGQSIENVELRKAEVALLREALRPLIATCRCAMNGQPASFSLDKIKAAERAMRLTQHV